MSVTPSSRIRITRFRALVAAGVTALLAVTGVAAIAAAPAAADPLTGVVSGTVTDVALAPLAGVTVTAWALDEDSGTFSAHEEGNVDTLVDGTFSFGGLPVGSYAFQYESTAAGIVDDFSGPGYTLDEAIAYRSTSFTSIADGDTLDASTILETGGSIHGSVKAPNGTSLNGQYVGIWRQSLDQDGMTYWPNDTFVDTRQVTAGVYTFDGLPPGTYAVRAGGLNDTYIPEFWEDDTTSTDASTAPTIPINPHDDFTADFTLATGGSITGVVTSSTKAKLGNVAVSAYTLDGDGDWAPYKITYTAANGSYALRGLQPGTNYTLAFDSGAYLHQFWKNKPTLQVADAFHLTSTATKSGFNAVLVKGASISGTVTQGVTGFPGEDDIQIAACKKLSTGLDCGEDNSPIGYGFTSYDQATGRYTVSSLLPGTYSVYVLYTGTGNWRSEYYGGNKRTASTASTFTVATGAAVAGRNIDLDAGATISGIVSGPAGAIEGVGIYAYPADDFFDGPVDSGYTAADGSYSIDGLELGDYILETDAPSSAGVADQWFDGVYSPKDATTIHVDAFAGFAGKNFTLPAGSTISGTLEGSVPGGIEGASVSLEKFLVPGGSRTDYVDYTETDASGAFSFGNLAPGEYAIYGEGGDIGGAGGYLGRYFDAPTGSAVAAAQRIEVTPGTSQDFSWTLDAGGTYTGRVTDGVDGVDNVGIDADGASTTTAADGTFTLTGVSPGAHTVTIDINETGRDFYSGTTVDGPDVGIGGSADLGDIVLDARSTIDGVILGSDGKPLKFALALGVTVDSNQHVNVVGGAVSDASGKFSMQDMPTTPTYLYFPSPGGKYADQFAGGGSEWSMSDPVTYPHAGATVYREVRLQTGGTITGVVKSKTTGKPLANIGVDLTLATLTGDYLDLPTVYTNKKGVYVVPGLDSGSYFVGINGYQDGPGLAYGDSYTGVYLADRATAKVNASLVSAQKISGTVTITGGAPLPGVTVTALQLDGPDSSEVAETTTTDTGAYSLYLLPGTHYVLYFTDPQGRVAPAYLGGTPDSGNATQLTVVKSALAGRNITLAPTGGSVDFDIAGTAETDPEGSMLLERLNASGDVVATQYLEGDGCGCGDLNDLLPITNLPAGDYRLTITGYSLASTYGGQYEPAVIGFTIEDGVALSLGSVMLTGLHNYSSYDFPSVVAGLEPTIFSAGPPRVGDTLIVNSGAWSLPVDTYYYQWTRDGKPIPGAVDSNYTPTPGDAGAHIGVQLGASNVDLPFPNYSYATELGAVVEDAPGPTSFTTEVTGAARVDSVLTAHPGEWTVPGLTFTYQWERYDTFTTITTPIAGATGATYKVTSADLDQLIGVVVMSHRTGYESGAVATFLSDPITPKTAVKLVKAPKVSSITDGWRVTPGTWSPATNPAVIWRVYNADGSLNFQNSASLDFVDAGVKAGTTRVTVEVQASHAGYTTTSVVLNVRLGQTSFAVDPFLPSTAQVGIPVLLDESGATATLPATTTHSYQWYRGTTKIPGATKVSYSPVAADAGKILHVRVTLSAAGYNSSTRDFAVASPVDGMPLMAAGAVNFTGLDGTTPVIGRTLTAVPTGWTPAPTSYTYQWQRGDGITFTDIPGAKKASYVPTFTDDGKHLQVVVTGTRKEGSVTSSATHSYAPDDPTVSEEIQSVTAPTIPAVAHVGVKLTATNGTWDVTPTSYSYQWYANEVAIDGARSSSYTPTPVTVGESIYVEVTAYRSGVEGSDPTLSEAAVVDPGVAVKATKAPALTVAGKTVKTVKLGQVISATGGTWPAAGLQLSYSWQVSTDNGVTWNGIPDENGKTLTLSPSTFAVGSSYRVVVTPAKRAGYLDSPAIASVALKGIA